MALMEAVLSTDGYRKVNDIMNADEVLRGARGAADRRPRRSAAAGAPRRGAEAAASRLVWRSITSLCSARRPRRHPG